MSKLMKIGLAIMAISRSGYGMAPATAQAESGRMIEFKSGPEGFNTRTFFYEGENEVVAFDAQFTQVLAKQSIDYLRTFTDKPISWLVITHPNPDKFNGASVFQAVGAKVVASETTAQAISGVHAYKEHYFVEIAKTFRRGEYPQQPKMDETFAGQLDLVLRDGERIQLRELSRPGVSNTQTVAYVPSAGALVVGDLMHYKAHAWLEGGIVNGKPAPTLDGWIADLEDLAAIYPTGTNVYGGRGITTELRAGVEEQIWYLQTARELIRKYLRELGKKAEEFNGPNSRSLYRELEARFQAQFPDYQLPYLIEYGVYGLVQSELAARAL